MTAMRRAKRHRLDLIQDRHARIGYSGTRCVDEDRRHGQQRSREDVYEVVPAFDRRGEYRCHIKKKEYVCDRCSPHRERNQNRHDCVKGRNGDEPLHIEQIYGAKSSVSQWLEMRNHLHIHLGTDAVELPGPCGGKQPREQDGGQTGHHEEFDECNELGKTGCEAEKEHHTYELWEQARVRVLQQLPQEQVILHPCKERSPAKTHCLIPGGQGVVYQWSVRADDQVTQYGACIRKYDQ